MRDTHPRLRRGRVMAILVALALALTTLVAGTGVATADGHIDLWLTVLHNNDGESELLPDGDEGGIGRFARVRFKAEQDALRMPPGDATKRVAMFVSSGDNFLAGPAFAASLNDGVFYDALALDALRYDAIAIGNHDFDFGPDVLADFIKEGFRRPGRPPYVSANLDFSGEPELQQMANRRMFVPYTIVRKQGERIGVVGATTENLPFISSPRDVIVNAVQPAVQAQVDVLTAMGIDKIVLISHLQDIDGDIELAGMLTGVDIMIAGGGDELLANPSDPLLPSDDPGDVFGPYPIFAVGGDGANIPVVTTSGQYGYLGRVTVGFDGGDAVMVDMSRSGPLRVVSKAIGPDGVNPMLRFVRMSENPVDAYVADLATNIIGTSEVALDGIRENVRSVETNEGNLIADALLWQAEQLAAAFGVPVPDVALQNGGGIRNDDIRGPGPISELDTFAMVPFPNFVTVIPDISREQFKDILENAVSRIDPPAAPGGTGRFAQIAGFSFTFDTTGTPMLQDGDGNILVPGTRVTEVMLDDSTVIVTGGAVVAGPDLTVATIDFLANGGDEYPFGGAPFTSVGVSYQQALSNYIQLELGGLISAGDYPEGGEGRITQVP